ncbi:hypothetical protein PG997_011835 [Apiospora hydei]|uniref:Uncharacterized protein n=1 Tax=Apiospora hydei TaxID=1337664 RepID=A0ABR1V511_9PEZI
MPICRLRALPTEGPHRLDARGPPSSCKQAYPRGCAHRRPDIVRQEAKGGGEASPEPYPESHDEYGGTHGIDQDIAPGVDWASNEALSAADSNLYIDPAMLDNTGDSSSSDGYACGDFEPAQIYPETNSTL